MKVLLLQSGSRRGSTRRCVEDYIDALGAYEKVELKEFIFPRDLPSFCRGCFSCFLNGEDTCPDSKYTLPIISSMEEADIVIIASPVYGLDVSGQIKALIDHLCFMWLSHRPNPKLFDKVGVVFTTAAGMGLKNTSRTMKNSFFFWGFKRIFTFKKAVAASKWEEVSERNKKIISKRIGKIAEKSAAAVSGINTLSHSLTFRLMWRMMRGMMKKNDWNPADRAHWEALGWLDKTKPF